MNYLPQYYTDNRTGISYTLVGDYYLPEFKQQKASQYTIGRFGRERLDYLKNYRKLVYLNLLTSGTLNSHLQEIDETANTHMELIARQIAEREGVNEKLKAEDAMLWVQRKNNINSRVIEMIRNELIYC